MAESGRARGRDRAGEGPGAEPADTLVLVPGLDGTALLFYRQLPLLAERFDVVGFPLPDDPACDMHDLVEDLASLARQVARGRVFLCGESFGGALAMSLALAHPEIPSGLVIVNSFPVIRTRLRLRLAPLFLRALPWGAMPLVRRFTEARLHSPHCLPEDLREFHERSKAIGRLGYIRRLEILQHYDIRDRLGELRTPTLFLAGDCDRLVPSVREARTMAAAAPCADMRVLEGYGHICLINHDLNLLDYIAPWHERLLREPRTGDGD